MMDIDLHDLTVVDKLVWIGVGIGVIGLLGELTGSLRDQREDREEERQALHSARMRRAIAAPPGADPLALLALAAAGVPVPLQLPSVRTMLPGGR